jgi:aminoglycoside N3'-acetyltransferase
VQAFVDFENYEEAVKAMREKDHKVFNEKFGDRYVRLIQVRNSSDRQQWYLKNQRQLKQLQKETVGGGSG